MKTLPSPSTVSPQNRTRPATNDTWSSEWPGVAITLTAARTCRRRSARRPATGPRRRAPRILRGPRLRPAAATGASNRCRNSGTASAWSRCACVSAMPADSAAPLRLLPRRASTCSGSAGPGSITHAGSPTIHVFVPVSVIGPAFDARTSATPSGTRSVTAATGAVSGTR